MCCISFASYIKPQLNEFYKDTYAVVYLSLPTSNHNTIRIIVQFCLLYIFRFLHQTTTVSESSRFNCWLYIFRFLHQTTTLLSGFSHPPSCISFASYIKPQLLAVSVSLSLSCISFASYIKPQLDVSHKERFFGCISFASYIKPQLSDTLAFVRLVVYLSLPTSNHNYEYMLLLLL